MGWITLNSIKTDYTAHVLAAGKKLKCFSYWTLWLLDVLLSTPACTKNLFISQQLFKKTTRHLVCFLFYAPFKPWAAGLKVFLLLFQIYVQQTIITGRTFEWFSSIEKVKVQFFTRKKQRFGTNQQNKRNVFTEIIIWQPLVGCERFD